MRVKRGRQNGDPMGSEKPRGKNREARKSGRDGTTWTGTERTIKDGLMRQFLKRAKGEGLGVSRPFRDNYATVFGHD